MAARTVTPSGMTSREWALLPAEVRLRSMFSSRVEHERTLAEMKVRLSAGIANEKRDGATMDKSRFIEEMRAIIKDSGYRRPDGVGKKSLQNLKSRARLELIWKMNVSQARGYAKWLADMTPEGLENEPCYELVRVMQRSEVRDWPTLWENFGGKFYGGKGSNKDYPREGRMIAKKTSPIWRQLSRFGTPWPPFDWGSGMGLAGIDLDEAEALGAVGPDDEPQAPLAAPFNAGHSMSAKGIPESGKENLRSAFGGAVKFDNERVILQRHLTPETDEQRQQTITESLRIRAAGVSDAGRDQFARARSQDDASPWPPGVDPALLEPEVLASTAAVSVGRKLLYHERWHGSEESAQRFATLIRGFLPDHVAVMIRDNHIHAWRPDLLALSADEIQAASVADANGLLLGYGQNLSDRPAAVVNFKNEAGEVIGGFFAPHLTARTYALARAKDFQDALGKAIRIFIDNTEVRP